MEAARLLPPAAVAASYLVGAIPFGFVLARVLKGVDVRRIGSGNIGATNVARAAGPRIGILAFVLDVAKGAAAATAIPLAAWAWSRGTGPGAEGLAAFMRAAYSDGSYLELAMACGMAAIVGHVWTIFLGFRGGKGVATSLGVLLGLAPWPTLAALFLWALVTRVTGYVSIGSIVAAAALPAVLAILHRHTLARDWRLLVFALLVAAIVVWRHRGNVKRLREGTEYRIPFGRRRT